MHPTAALINTSAETGFPLEDSQMNTEAWLSQSDRPALGAATATLHWTETQYDRQTTLQTWAA